MREFEYRGKTSQGDWVYGSLQNKEPIIFNTRLENYVGITTQTFIVGGRIWHHGVYLVKKETVGQYTGLKDKNGTKIFEGDIVKDEFGRIMKVIWKEKWAKFQFEIIKITGDKWTNNFKFADLTTWFDEVSVLPEIIGNIFDNSELLRGEI